MGGSGPLTVTVVPAKWLVGEIVSWLVEEWWLVVCLVLLLSRSLRSNLHKTWNNFKYSQLPTIKRHE